MIPDHAVDREMLAALKHADWDAWRNRSLEEIERAGHHELLNWMLLAGAMAESRDRQATPDLGQGSMRGTYRSDKLHPMVGMPMPRYDLLKITSTARSSRPRGVATMAAHSAPSR